MEDSKPPNSDILTASLEEIQKSYNNFSNSANGFIEKNPQINRYNKTRYDSLYRSLGNFYRMIVNTSNLDLSSIPIQQKLYYAEKKEYSLQIKDSLKDLLEELEDLTHPEEESPFYIPITDIKE